MIDWPVTFRCNNNCLTCINRMEYSEEKGLRKKGSGEVPFSQIKDVIDSFDTEKHTTLGLGGGEPTISPKFFKVLEYARKKLPETLIFVVSNGRMLSYDGFIRKLERFCPPEEKIRFGVALYSHEPGIHDGITRAEGSFEQTVKGVENLLEAGYETELRVIVNGKNYKKLPETAEWIADRFEGVLRVTFIHMKYTGNALVNRDSIKVRITDANPHVLEAVDRLESEGFNVRMFHFPLCTIPKKYWKNAEGVTKQLEDLDFAEACERCSVRDRCPMIWKSYLKLFGEDEFEPVG